MRTPRETVAAALFAQLQTMNTDATPFVTMSRRTVPYDGDGGRAAWPALYLQQLQQDPKTQHFDLTAWTLNFRCWIYLPAPADRGVPTSPLINNYLDALEAAIQGMPQGEKQTLGGLVENVTFSIPVQIVEGLVKPPAIIAATLAVLCGI
jgi:hypothetical protein